MSSLNALDYRGRQEDLSGSANKLLDKLSFEALRTLKPFLNEIELPARLVLARPGNRLADLYFLESGLASVCVSAGTDRIEVGLIGPEGMIGATALLGPRRAPCEIMIQMAGRAQQLSLHDWSRHAQQHPEMTELANSYLHYTLVHACDTAMSAGRGTLERRLSRWLLMAHDRLSTDVIETTHEHLASSLGVRRPGVTVALHRMETESAIRSKRNAIAILDRSKLRAMAGAHYGSPEQLYEQLFGTVLSRD